MALDPHRRIRRRRGQSAHCVMLVSMQKHAYIRLGSFGGGGREGGGRRLHRHRRCAARSCAAEGEYEEVLARLSSLITQKVRAHTSNRGNQWDLMHRYLQILELEEPISWMKFIHVAGTKGKVKCESKSEAVKHINKE